MKLLVISLVICSCFASRAGPLLAASPDQIIYVYPNNNLEDGNPSAVLPRASQNLVDPGSHLKDCCLFSQDPVSILEMGAYRLADTLPVRSQEDLIGKRVILIHGFTYGGAKQFLEDHDMTTDIYYTANRKSAFRMLERGRADYFLDYPRGADAFLENRTPTPFGYDALAKTGLYLVLHKDYPDAVNMLRKLEAIAKRIR